MVAKKKKADELDEKDKAIVKLMVDNEDSLKVARAALNGWGRTLNDLKFWYKLIILYYIVVFLLGIAWGIMLFT